MNADSPGIIYYIMTRNNNVSRLSGKWKNITKDCDKCNFKLRNSDGKFLCKCGNIIYYLFTKGNRIYSKCTLK